MNLTDWMAIIGAITGVSGTVLGIVTMVDMMRKNKVRLRVVPKLAWTNPHGLAWSTSHHPQTGSGFVKGAAPDRFAIEVINLSAFPITIDDAGFGHPDNATRHALIVPEVSTGYEWPPVVESRRSVTIYQPLSGLSWPIKSWPRSVYVETECGKRAFGRSDALDSFVDHVERLFAEQQRECQEPTDKPSTSSPPPSAANPS